MYTIYYIRYTIYYILPYTLIYRHLAAKELLQLTKPILLQRKKTDTDANEQKLIELPPKTELVVWIPLSKQQRELYRGYIDRKQCLLEDINASGAGAGAKVYPVEIITHLRSLAR